MKPYKNYFDEEMLRILGQMDMASEILDYLYLGSEWNACNLEELQSKGYELKISWVFNFKNSLLQLINFRWKLLRLKGLLS